MELLESSPNLSVMDKNKAAYKLKGLPPVYVINLDDKPDRWKFMEDQFKY